jgi:hypothetical protein
VRKLLVVLLAIPLLIVMATRDPSDYLCPGKWGLTRLTPH